MVTAQPSKDSHLSFFVSHNVSLFYSFLQALYLRNHLSIVYNSFLDPTVLSHEFTPLMCIGQSGNLPNWQRKHMAKLKSDNRAIHNTEWYTVNATPWLKLEYRKHLI